MPDLPDLIKTVTAPARHVQERVAATLRGLREQAPGARMVGEFAVKIGLKEIGKRISGDKGHTT